MISRNLDVEKMAGAHDIPRISETPNSNLASFLVTLQNAKDISCANASESSASDLKS